MTAGGDQLTAGDRLAGFRIVQPLGAGARGSAYVAEGERHGEHVVLRVIPSQDAEGKALRDHFEAEARNATAITHPNLVPVLSYGTSGDRLYFTTPYLDGATLAEALDRPGSLDPSTALRIAADIASALDALHAREVVHGDVSPKNIFLAGASGEEEVYLTDLGLSGLGSVGTLVPRGAYSAYAAPEQTRAGRVDASADVYALGRVLDQMLSDSETSRSRKSRALDAVIARAVALEPRYRYASAGDFVADAVEAYAKAAQPRLNVAVDAERRRIAEVAAPLGVSFAAINSIAGWVPISVLAIVFVVSAMAVLLGDARYGRGVS